MEEIQSEKNASKYGILYTSTRDFLINLFHVQVKENFSKLVSKICQFLFAGNLEWSNNGRVQHLFAKFTNSLFKFGEMMWLKRYSRFQLNKFSIEADKFDLFTC